MVLLSVTKGKKCSMVRNDNVGCERNSMLVWEGVVCKGIFPGKLVSNKRKRRYAKHELFFICAPGMQEEFARLRGFHGANVSCGCLAELGFSPGHPCGHEFSQGAEHHFNWSEFRGIWW